VTAVEQPQPTTTPDAGDSSQGDTPAPPDPGDEKPLSDYVIEDDNSEEEDTAPGISGIVYPPPKMPETLLDGIQAPSTNPVPTESVVASHLWLLIVMCALCAALVVFLVYRLRRRPAAPPVSYTIDYSE